MDPSFQVPKTCDQSEQKDRMLFLDTTTPTGVSSIGEIVEHAKAKKDERSLY
jgi:hypothetical protein